MRTLRDAVLHPQAVSGLAHVSPVAGLARRRLGFFDVLAQSVAAVAPSGAATTLPLLAYAATGDAAVLAYAVATLVVLMAASSITVFAKRMAAAGSLYSFVAKGTGHGSALVTGAGMIVGYAFVSMFALYAAGHYLAIPLTAAFPGARNLPLTVGALAIVGLGALYLVVLLGGLKISARLTLLVEVISVVAIIAFVALLFAQLPPASTAVVPPARDVDAPSLLVGIAVAVTSFVGFESSAALGVEARRPFATVPRALVWTVIGAGVLFVVVASAVVTGFARLGLDLGESDSPVNDLAGALGVPWVGLALDVSISLSFFAAAVASTTALVRVLFSLARESRIPVAFGRTSARRHAPVFAIVAVAPLIVGVPFVLGVLPLAPWDVMQALLTAATGGYVIGYVVVCFAAPWFLRRIGEVTFWPVVISIAGGTILAASFVVYLAESATGVGAPGALAFIGAMIAVAVLLVLANRRRTASRDRRHDVAYDEPTASDVLGAADPNSASAAGR